MTKEDYELQRIEYYKEVVEMFVERLDNLPLPVFTVAMTGKEVFPVMNRENDIILLEKLAQACIQTIIETQKSPLIANRPNDVSTLVETILERAGNNLGLRVEGPKPAQGRTPGGYPDRLVWLEDEPTYLEVKVSREENIEQGSARNFFYQPTVNTKILYSARHLLAGFAIREIAEKRWILTSWKIVDLWFLRVKLKPEYNADNLEIYRTEAVLLKGNGEGIVYRKH